MYSRTYLKTASGLIWLLVLIAPLTIAYVAFGGPRWDFSVPMVYGKYDDMWQLILTKSLLDNGWFLNNPYLGAPGIATGHFNSAAQTSSIHSVIMKLIGVFVSDAVKVQYYYYFLNFSLISLTTYVSCRLLGVSRLFAVSVAILFSLSLYRLNMPYFAFISNYFMVPLAIVVVVWCAKGEYLTDGVSTFNETMQHLRKSRKFWFSILIVFLMAVSDGYYAFFTALLLGLSSALAFFHKNHRRLSNSLVPLVFAGLIIGTTLLVMTPLTHYRNANSEEFFPGGVQDPALTIHPFEAEVYASSLKAMLTPSLNHRVGWIAHLAEKMRRSGAEARKYGYGLHGQLGSLASLCFLLLMGIFFFPKWILENKFVNSRSGAPRSDEAGAVLYILGVVAGFIFISETVGGLGSLIAFLYPFIRAYERFSIFLIFVVLLAAAFFLTYKLPENAKNRPLAVTLVAIVTVIFLLDQIPVNLARSVASPDAKRFLAERALVHTVEKELQPGDMVYQYPYAQYMAPSPYYGMGSQAQTRSYLHSHSLRWSNGASKNSRVDIWHRNLAKLPAEELLNELVIYGFRGVLIDRWVVKDDEFLSVADAARSIGSREAAENTTAQMVFFKFPDYGFHLEMDRNFRLPERIFIHRGVPLDYAKIPSYLDGRILRKILNSNGGVAPEYFDLNKYPGLLDAGLYSAMRVGLDANLETKKLLGDVNCVDGAVVSSNATDVEVRLDLKNNSDAPWGINLGSHPITLGYHIVDSKGAIVSWDNGYRINSSVLVTPGEEQRVSIKVPSSDLREFGGKGDRMVFELLQEGNAWFGINSGNKTCNMQLPPIPQQ